MQDTVTNGRKARRAWWKLGLVAFGVALVCSTQPTVTTSATDEVSGPTNSIPADILQLFQKQAAAPPWNQDAPAKTQAILQQCAALQQLLTDGATDEVLSNALVASTVRVSVFTTFGQSLYNAGDTHHAEMFFASVVNDHPTRATAKQLARSWLWLGKLYEADGQASKYQQGNPAEAGTQFQTAAADYLAAKDASQDWVRSSGWLGAAACYRELGNQPMRRLCLTSLLQELSANAFPLAGADVTLGPVRRDIATHLLATSYYEDGRYQEAAAVYQQLHDRIAANSTEYPGQATYLGVANAGLSWCAARLAEQSAVNSNPTSQ